MSPGFDDYGPPVRVEGGLRARSTRGAIGQSWWSRRFVEVLESFALGSRLTRGRAYARRGQVLRLDVSPGTVTAEVQGSRPRPYPVRIGLAAYPSKVWRRLESELAGQAFFSARLLAGDLPAELEELFAEAGAPLFPAAIGELDQSCGCPDFAVPCKHLAATFYLLAEAFDADPFHLLHWRGRSRADLLDRLRTLRGAHPDGTDPTRGASAGPGSAVGVGPESAASAGPGSAVGVGPESAADVGPESAADATNGVPVVGAARALAGLPAVEPDAELDRFWLAPVALPDRPPTLATGPELLLRQLGPPGAAVGGPGLAERLRRAYREFGRGEAASPREFGRGEAASPREFGRGEAER
ncbi:MULTISPECIES: SWIM zinc finger family protein [unclassified Micromonospora]|uniref:SWIM zinc finger family protein n=1 Tax=unclassified Micromonospora TaxID=2617518 RepID=UPI001C22BD80|nr:MULTISPECIES: SWIM zinc finger family protein [unclassified Micromonospora]MBU8856360.1 SWIM zinc finger family protein [Micromonospora sp. WMMB482]MDM4781968.1 SWIM zinc finger family protein [Micromonospora sp. b486]